MEPRYDPQSVETRWQETWEAEGLYAAEAADPRPAYVVAFPPPNVTGELHMGHALQLALADALIRWKRMQGYNCLFQPGYDHAGISTQYQVEKALEAEGRRRQDVGREAFVELVWDWLRRYGRTIMTQFRRMGASMDYRRERFTMDEGYTRAVLRFFVHLWEKGYLYRDHRIVNWCPYHLSALSDLELDHVEVEDELVYVRYPLADGSGHVTIATARPATILADVAVAVHPDDERYRGLVGRRAVVPFVEREVPVVADERVDPAFGTGALKVTPGHDPVDFEIGRTHGLPEPMVVGPDGRMNGAVPEVAGMTQEEAAAAVLAWCEERGLLERREPYRHTIAVCERCGSRIEPLISLQWWCRMDELKRPALEALRAGRVRYHPPSQHRFAIESLEAAPDWNVSRQIWWGHQLPVWYCPDGHLTVAEREPEACAECGTRELVRDPDVLDTWFSSALWPFATLGWPERTPDLERFYPGDFNITAREIIRLWENRMIFSGLELLGEVPFRDVIIHSTVLAPDGRRMSKSLGTGVDPLDVIAEYGTDATRYGLAKISSQQDTRLSYEAFAEGRSLAIKIWNAARLILLNAEGVRPALAPRDLEERWILARLDAARAGLEEAWGRFDFAEATRILYRLVFDDFCDWYAEAVKPRLSARDPDACATALAALERLLALLHPVMPHVSEEIWSRLPERKARLIVSPWPEPDPRWADAEEAEALERVRDAAVIFRRSGVRVELGSEDERRIFDAVVKPQRVRVDGDREAEIERLRREIARAEGMLANEGFVQKAPPEVVAAEREKLERYRRELAALGDPSC
ncbi:MAG TPA: valine--tRNA ligase [Gaiellaceae bacterium]|nr:valine--tRNA ligase [Gaiellaceae bacterium]